MHKKLCWRSQDCKNWNRHIQQLINQIERARTNLDLIDKASIIINQVQTKKSFEFTSSNLTKKSNKSISYYETKSENFQQLKKAMKQKNDAINKRTTEKSANSSTIEWDVRDNEKFINKNLESAVKFKFERNIQSSKKSFVIKKILNIWKILNKCWRKYDIIIAIFLSESSKQKQCKNHESETQISDDETKWNDSVKNS
jgi:hypothetical protein